MSDSQYPGSMYVEESGTPGSPAIVFIHGAGQSGREWREHMARLAGFHCLAPDLPGFGRSNRLAPAAKERVADLLAELIEKRVPAKRASVVGISSAGLHIHALLERHPDRVERAIIDGAPPYDAPRPARALMRLCTVGLVPFIHTRPGMAFFGDTHDPEDLRVASRLAFWRDLSDCLGDYATFGAPCPTLLVAGETETRVRPTNAALAALMPHGEAWYAPGLGHCWQRAAPDLHIRTVEAWVSGQALPSELRSEPPAPAGTVERLRAQAVATADAAPDSGERTMSVRDRLEDWLSSYPDTPAVRFVHRAPLVLWRLGLGRFEGDVVITTTGRRSGLPRHIVIGGARIGSRVYLFDPYGDRAQWYRNLVADPIVTVQDGRRSWTARAVHLDDRDDAVALYGLLRGGVARIFRRYLAAQGIEDSAESFTDAIDRIHIVRLDPVDEPGPPPLPSDLAWVWPLAGLFGLVALLARLSLRFAVAGSVVAGAALLVSRGRQLADRLVELMILRPTGPIGRMLYRDATATHGQGWRYCHEKLVLQPQDRLLDVGCGGGTFLSQALETVESAAGIDHSPDMVALAKENNAAAAAEGRLEVRFGDAAALPWADATFDAVSNLAAFMLADDPEGIVHESARVLKTGGRFVVVTMAKPEHEDLGTRVTRWFMPQARLYEDEELSRLLRDAGFDEVEAYSPDGEFQIGYGVRI